MWVHLLVGWTHTPERARILAQAHTPAHTLSNPVLTHWGPVTHICVSKLTTIGSDNGLSPGRCQAIILTNARILLIRTSEAKFEHLHSRKSIWNCRLEKWRPFCLGLNGLSENDLRHTQVCTSYIAHETVYYPLSAATWNVFVWNLSYTYFANKLWNFGSVVWNKNTKA